MKKRKIRKLNKNETRKIGKMPKIVEELSEQTSELISQIGKLTIEMQNVREANKQLKERIAFCEGHIREKENKLNMIRSVLRVER